jgi:HNH endonuclease
LAILIAVFIPCGWSEKSTTTTWHPHIEYSTRVKSAEEFWGSVDQSPGPGQCHPWRGTIRKSKTGRPLYGQVYWEGRCRGAHVVAFTLANGRPPAGGMNVMHTCDYPPCCNGEHLVERTPGQNFQDMKAKGRDVDLNAERKARTHCPANHEYTEENTYWYKGTRHCKKCDRARNKPGSPRVERRNKNRQERRRELREQGLSWKEIVGKR